MRKIFSAALLCGLVVLLFVTCKKDVSSTDLSDVPALVGEARAYFTDSVAGKGVVNPANYRAGVGKVVLWDRAEVVDLSFGKAVIVPVSYSGRLVVQSSFDGGRRMNLDGLTRLFVYQDGKRVWHADLVTAFPDSLSWSGPGRGFSGYRYVEDWNGHGVARYWYGRGAPVRKYSPGLGGGTGSGSSIGIAACEIIYGYNYAVGNETGGEAWEEEEGDCAEANVVVAPGGGNGPTGIDYGVGASGGGGGGGGGSSAASIAASMIVVSGNDPITNLAQYLKCFQIDDISTYKVTLYVDQPVPGSTAPYTFQRNGQNGVFSIGHTFLTFQQSGTSGTIVRSIGFYPASWVTPVNPNDPGSLNNDQGHGYNISLAVSVSGQQFMEILNTMSTGNTMDYNLNYNNCTTLAISSLSAGGIKIQTTQGVWPLGGGDDPGDLGEDIRYMQLASNMARGTQTGNAPSNSGTCQ